MAYAEHTNEYHEMTAGRATGGVTGIFLAMGIGLAFLGFAASFALRGLGAGGVDPNNVIAGVSALMVGLLPFVATPLLSVLGGVWAGQATKSTASGSIAGGLGSLIGIIVMYVVVAIGFWLGAAIAGFDLGTIDWTPGFGVAPGLQSLLTYLFSVTGILYLLANVIIGAVAGAIIGALAQPVVAVEHREVARGPARI